MPLAAARHIRRATRGLATSFSRYVAVHILLSALPALPTTARLVRLMAESSQNHKLYSASAYNTRPDRRPHTIETTDVQRRYNTTPYFLEDAENEVEAQDEVRQPLRQASLAHSSMGVPEFGKWEALSTDYGRLKKESTPPSPGDNYQRLVDTSAGSSDLELWACLLGFCQRTKFHSGALYLLGEFFRRQTLWKTGNLPIDDFFWRIVVELSIHDDQLLENVLEYAQWMRQEKDSLWPALYSSIITPLLLEGDVERAFSWHLRLSAFFGPDEHELVQLIQGAIFDEDQGVKNLLRAIYITSPHRGLYDKLIPFIWRHGRSGVAVRWRHILIKHNDRPRSSVSRPFIRYLAAYFPQKSLVEEELRAAGLDPATGSDEPQEDATPDQNLRELMNRVHGKTFGIEEKTFSDTFGAKWFASSWVSLETAIWLVHTLGVKKIGPLSLRSIALREKSAKDVAHWLKHLESCGIGIGNSRYSKAIMYMATAGDDETLHDLVSSDIHPDVFEDDEGLAVIQKASANSGDWRTSRVIAAVRVAEGMDCLAGLYNRSLANTTLRSLRVSVMVLAEMVAKEIPVFDSTSIRISEHIVDYLPRFYSDPSNVEPVVAFTEMGRLLLSTPFPLSSEAWRILLGHLSSMYNFNLLESISMAIIRHYSAVKTERNRAMNIHSSDVPSIFTWNSLARPFQALPGDLPINNDNHPITKIFDHRFQKSLIRHTVRQRLVQPQKKILEMDQTIQMSDFSIARGVKFLAMLKDAGLNVPDQTVRKAVVACLVDLFGYEWVPRKTVYALAKINNHLTLEEAIQLFNRAWGAELLPSADETRKLVDIEAMRRQATMEKSGELDWRRRKTEKHLLKRERRRLSKK